MDQVRFETPEDLELDVEVAGPASRLLAVTFDHLLLLAGFLVLLVALALTAELGDLPAQFGLHLAGLLVVVYGFSQFVYFTLFEIVGAGRTPGKRWTGLATVMDGGYALTPGASLIRNLFRILDAIPVMWILPLLDRRQRRLGDIVAGTLVVRTVRREIPATPFAQQDADAMNRTLDLGVTDARRFSPGDLQVLEEFFQRYGGLGIEARKNLARRLTDRYLTALGRERPAGIADHALLKEIYLEMRENLR
jgi:uncharacterized RDD family membrane protein YckC